MTTAQCVQSAAMAKAGMVTGEPCSARGAQVRPVGTQRVTLGSSPSVGEDGVAA